jgi:lipoyl(octanoyl) transferase
MEATRGHLIHRHLGRIGWQEAFQLQLANWQALVDGGDQHVLLTLEHDPVVTLGRRAVREHLLHEEELRRRGVLIVDADRGGEVTFHGPGQLVLYLNVGTTRTQLGPGDLVRSLANAIVEDVAQFGVAASYDSAHPGVWVNQRKLAAVGMRITRGASLHGAAINVSNDTSIFDLFVPCGMPGAHAASLHELGAVQETIESVARRLVPTVARKLNLELRSSTFGD